jgi:hypothetical protein
LSKKTPKTPPPGYLADGIDYGPAYAAIADLAEWALGLAAADVADWPEGRRRVKSATRFVLDRLHGKRTRAVPSDDILFTAGLLARIFEADVGLGMNEMVSILDQLGLPTEVVPMMPRAQHSQPSVRPMAAVIPLRARQIRVAPPCIECSRSPIRNAA